MVGIGRGRPRVDAAGRDVVVTGQGCSRLFVSLSGLFHASPINRAEGHVAAALLTSLVSILLAIGALPWRFPRASAGERQSLKALRQRANH